MAGRRTRITHADGFFIDQDYLVTGEVEKIRENGATSGPGVLATFAYDDLGRRDTLTRGSGLVTRYDYDPVSRLTSLAHDFGGNGNDLVFAMAYNPAGQIVTRSGAHSAYVWTGHGSGSTASSHDGLNRITDQGGTGIGHDSRGNVTAIGSASYAYTSDNLMVSAPGAALHYDPLDRLRFISGGGGEQRVYDGADLIVELDTNGTALVRRHVFGPGTDEPLVWYEGSGTSDRRQLIADERGSIVGAFDGSGASLGYRGYDEYGVTQQGSGNAGRFGYTGQAWLPEIGLYYYKARMYNPALGGRFMQTDPNGYGDGMNRYVYAGGDPVNSRDPSGLAQSRVGIPLVRCVGANYCGSSGSGTITVTGSRADQAMRDTIVMLNRIATHEFIHRSGAAGGESPENEIVVTGQRPGRPDLSSTLPPPQPAVVSPWSLPPGVTLASGPENKEDFCGSREADLPEGAWANACRVHDACYASGQPKEVCDAKFFFHILADCSGTIYIPALCIPPAIVGYNIVRFFGGAAYRRSNPRRQ